jgi:hypothetical protein
MDRKKQQVPPLRYAPVGMTILLLVGDFKTILLLVGDFDRISPIPRQNCHPDRSVAQWRDLLFCLYDWADWGCCWPTRPGAGGLGAAGFLGGSAFLPGARIACSVVPSIRGMNSTMPASPIS